MGFNLGKTLKKAVKTVATVTGFAPATEAAINAAKKLTGGETSNEYGGDTLLNAATGLMGQSGTNLGTLLGNLTGNEQIGNLLGGLTNINWGNSIFSAKQAKEMAKWNSELNYQYQTQLNNQGFEHDQEMLKMQQDYDTNMANTAVQRRKADLEAANINPIHAADLDASGGGLGGGSGLSGGTAQTSKADWLGLKLQQLAAERDAQRVQIEQANSASSGRLMAAQEQNTLAEMAKTVAELPYVGKQKEAEINNIIAGTVKSRAESAKSIADTQRVQQGWIANILGTNASDQAKALLGAGTALIPGVGIGFKAYKGMKAAKGFSNFLKAVK